MKVYVYLAGLLFVVLLSSSTVFGQTISVSDYSGTNITHNSNFAFGNVAANSDEVMMFRVHNTGGSDLTITSFALSNGQEFSLMYTTSAIPSGGYEDFFINFAPPSTGPYSDTVTITSNATNYANFIFTVDGTGVPSEPEIHVMLGYMDICTGLGMYNFGNEDIGMTPPYTHTTFTILNYGSDYLNLSTPYVSISNTTDFSLDISSITTSIPYIAGNSTTFGIAFCPATTGSKTCTVTILSDDPNEGTYTFTLTGTGVEPEINVKQGSNNILSGSGSYDFGSVYVRDMSSEVTFTIQNLGAGNLFLTGTPKISITGVNAALFEVDETSTSYTVISTGSTTFTIKFKPINTGLKTANVSISNNDQDENPYTFTIQGTGKKFDFNGDGYDDILVGAKQFESSGTGRGYAFMFFGSSSPSASLTYTNANVTFKGNASTDYFGYSVSSAGDFNGDGYDDVIIGAPQDDDNGTDCGVVFIFFGSSSPSSTLWYYNANVTLYGLDTGGNFGCSVSCAGNVNNDDYSDVIIGAQFDNGVNNNTGCAYIFLGRQYPYSSYYASSANIIIQGEDEDSRFGYSVSGAGDVNSHRLTGDEHNDDVIIGAPCDERGGDNYTGCAYILFGNVGWNPASTYVSYDTSNVDVILIGEDGDDLFGISVSNAGDVNGDYYDDVIVGAQDDEIGTYSNQGAAYMFFGSDSWSDSIYAYDADVVLYGPYDGSVDFDKFGCSVSCAGDVNNDGYSDIIIGAFAADINYNNPNAEGLAFIYYGSNSWNSVYSNARNDADVILQGPTNFSYFGMAVSSAGDYNGDTYDDIIVISWGSSGATVGHAFVFKGSASLSSTISAGSADQEITALLATSVSGGK